MKKKILWWLCLCIAPLILLGIELFHPAGFTNDPGMFQYLSEPQPTPYAYGHKALGYFGPQWWFILHMIQTPLVILVAIGLWLMMEMVEDVDELVIQIFSWLSRVSTFVFLTYYTILDSVGGIGLGRTLILTKSPQWTPEQVEAFKLLLNEVWIDKWVGGVGSVISQTGSWAIFFATVFAAIALFLAKKAPLPALVIFVAFGWELQVSHASYNGPIAFGLLIISAAWIYFQKSEKSDVEKDI